MKSRFSDVQAPRANVDVIGLRAAAHPFPAARRGGDERR